MNTFVTTPDIDPDFDFDHSPRLCIGCPYSNKKVGTSGKWNSPVVILGESPGVQEMRGGKPFVGPSGDVIRQSWPKDLGFSFEDAFVINSIQCFAPSGTKDPARMYKAVCACSDRVKSLIGAAPRKMILAFGKWAGTSITGIQDFKIMSQRGTINSIVHPGREGETCEVTHILHPAYLLRGQGNLNHFKSDIRRGLSKALGIKGQDDGYTDPEVGQLATVDQIQQLIDYIREIYLKDGKKVNIAADLETTGFNWWKDRILCISLYLKGDVEESDSKGDNIGYIIDWDRILLEWKSQGINIQGLNGARCIKGTEIPLEQLYGNMGHQAHIGPFLAGTVLWVKVKELMEMPEVNWIWHNGKFDIKFLRKDGINARIDSDSFLASYALDEKPGHGLEEIAKNRLNAPAYKGELDKYINKKNDSFEKVPKNILWLYAARDVKNTLGIYESLETDITADKNTNNLYHSILLPVSEMLSWVEMNGFAIDAEFVKENDEALTKEIEAAQLKMSEIVGYWVNPNSPQQVTKLLYDELGLRLKGKRPPDTSKEVLDKLYEETQHPVLKAIRNYRSLVKAHSTYVKAIYKNIFPDGRIHSTYNHCGTKTGRLASSEPNLQNIPRDKRIRRMYCAAPGKILVEGDYNTAELRALAALSKDEFLTGIFLDDKRNLHDEVSVKMYGDAFTPDQRIRAKAINFGIPYGREAFSIAEEFDISKEEAQRLINEWFATAPQAASFIEKCRNAPSNGQTLVNCVGRKRRPGVVSPEQIKGLMNEFANFFMQSTINEFTLSSACAMMDELKVLDAKIVNLVHDSLLVECLPEQEETVKRIMKYYMEEIPKGLLDTPILFKVDFKVGHHWGLLKGY